VVAYLQKKGVPLSVYIDDGIFGAASAVEWNAMRSLIWDTVTKAGWTIEQDKSDQENMGAMSKHYLGFIVNTKFMKIYLPPEKIENLRSFIVHFLQTRTHSLKKLAKLLGKIVACIPSHGPFARVCTRSGYIDLQCEVDRRGWDGQVTVATSTLAELQLFLKVLGPRNGFPIRHHLTDLRIDHVLTNPSLKTPVIHQAMGSYGAIIASDASDFKVACQWLEGSVRDAFTFTLMEQETLTSSGERELLAVLKSIRHFRHALQLQGINFLWITDSENLVSFLHKGSPKVHIHEKVTEIYTLLFDMNCTLEPVHLLRTDERIQLVDDLSKVRDTDNWSIDDHSFQILHKQFTFYSSLQFYIFVLDPKFQIQIIL